MNSEDTRNFEIIVNASEHKLHHDEVTYAQVVKIAFPGHHHGEFTYSVTFEDAESKPHDGTLAEGGKVTVKRHDTTFDVTETNKS